MSRVHNNLGAGTLNLVTQDTKVFTFSVTERLLLVTSDFPSINWTREGGAEA